MVKYQFHINKLKLEKASAQEKKNQKDLPVLFSI